MWTYWPNGADQFIQTMGGRHASMTTIMPISYNLDDNGMFSCMAPTPSPPDNTDCADWDDHAAALQAEGYPTVPMVSLPPGSKTDGLTKLLADKQSQAAFIQKAVDVAEQKGHAGFSIDWEPTGDYTVQELRPFMSHLASALHAAGKTLRYAGQGTNGNGWLGPGVLSTGVDRFQDMMNGYQLLLDVGKLKARMHGAGGPDKYCLGLDPSQPPKISQATFQQQLDVAAKAGVRHICVWEDGIGDLGVLWDGLATFLKG